MRFDKGFPRQQRGKIRTVRILALPVERTNLKVNRNLKETWQYFIAKEQCCTY
jgi:hypothetical protein